MQVKNKKLIAREFLFLSVCILITLLTFCITMIIQYSNTKSIEKQNIQKTELLHKYSGEYISKINRQKDFTKKYNSYSGLLNKNTDVWNQLRSIVENDSLEYKWDNKYSNELKDLLKKIGFNNPIVFKKFIEENLLNDDDYKHYYKVKKLQQEIKKNENIIKKNQNYFKEIRIKNSLKAFLISFLILFVIRYFYLSIMWSIKTLRQ